MAVLTVDVEKENAGLYANLFYYNAERGELEFMCAGVVFILAGRKKKQNNEE